MGLEHTMSNGSTRYLYRRNVGKGGRVAYLYFFSKDPNGTKGERCNLPDDMVVSEKGSMLYVKKQRAA